MTQDKKKGTRKSTKKFGSSENTEEKRREKNCKSQITNYKTAFSERICCYIQKKKIAHVTWNKQLPTITLEI